MHTPCAIISPRSSGATPCNPTHQFSTAKYKTIHTEILKTTNDLMSVLVTFCCRMPKSPNMGEKLLEFKVSWIFGFRNKDYGCA